MPRLLLAGFHWGRGRDYTYFARTNENHPTSRICFFGWQTKLHPVLSTYSTSHLPFPVWHWGREDWSTHLSYFDGSQMHPARHSSNEFWYACPKRVAEIWSLEKHRQIYISTEYKGSTWIASTSTSAWKQAARTRTSHGTFSCRERMKQKSWSEQTLLVHQFESRNYKCGTSECIRKCKSTRIVRFIPLDLDTDTSWQLGPGGMIHLCMPRSRNSKKYQR